MTANFICGGKLGDFIHQLQVVQAYWCRNEEPANVYIRDDHHLKCEPFQNDLKTTYQELWLILAKQRYINDFRIHHNENINFNLNEFRTNKRLHQMCWTKMNQETWPWRSASYQWIHLNEPKLPFWQDKVVVHVSQNKIHHNYKANPLLDRIIKRFGHACVKTLSTNQDLINIFRVIDSCRLFIGEQSSPLAIASALDVPRIALLSPTEHRFHYIGEEQFSDKISWFLDEDNCYYANL